ncbi:MAG TPA: LysR substrate-binding domain-containing protein, partial [Actinomycetes bacterium]|nr:LysR substrate-binding domain-containing protein [Actinomycetes bacterium]
LEREAGARLVERNGRSVRLTDAGRALVRRADAILTELAGAESDLQLIAGLRGGQVRVSTFASAATALLPEAVTAFRDAHPGVRVELSLVEDTAEAVEGLRAGRSDLALLAEPLADPGPVETHHLLDDPLLAVLPAGHRLARRRALRLADLAAEPWVLGGGPACSDRATILRACHAAGFEPRVSVEFPTDDYHATQGMVAAGAGITLLPRLALSVPRDDLVVRPLAGGGLHRQVVAATRRGDRAPATLAMLRQVEEVGEGITRSMAQALLGGRGGSELPPHGSGTSVM